MRVWNRCARLLAVQERSDALPVIPSVMEIRCQHSLHRNHCTVFVAHAVYMWHHAVRVFVPPCIAERGVSM
jgi:hypothetical protein